MRLSVTPVTAADKGFSYGHFTESETLRWVKP